MATVLFIFCLFLISIHAPTRGATAEDGYYMSANQFQSTLPRGERPATGFCAGWIFDFNPRSHEGSDHCIGRCKYSTCNFNPRSHEGSDEIFSVVISDGAISIHAPTRGATRKAADDLDTLMISIHAPTRGATMMVTAGQKRVQISIRAPARGATRKECSHACSI